MTPTERSDKRVVRLRRTLLLLARNQDTHEQREAAGRHLALLYAAMLTAADDQGRDRHTDSTGEGEEGQCRNRS